MIDLTSAAVIPDFTKKSSTDCTSFFMSGASIFFLICLLT
jgi:hypothetical protein